MRGQKVEDFEIFGEIFVKLKEWNRFLVFFLLVVIFVQKYLELMTRANFCFRYFSLITCYFDVKSRQQITKIVNTLKKESSTSLAIFVNHLFAALGRIFTALSPLDNFEIASFRCLISFLFDISPSSCFKLVNETTEKMEQVCFNSLFIYFFLFCC